MIIDAVFNFGGKLDVIKTEVDIDGGEISFELEGYEDLLFPGYVFQLTAFAKYRYQRRSLVIHSVSGGVFTAATIHADVGLANDPSVAEELEAYVNREK